MSDLPEWARRLDLSPHPEGGWFRETWRSGLTMPQSALPPDYTGPRSAGTAILFLLMPGQQSAWHTVRSAELWLYHSGGPLLLQVGAEQDSATTHLLGADILAGEHPQHCRSARALAARPPSRRRTLPGQLCRDTGIRLRRLRAGRAYRLSSCTAADTSAALSGARSSRPAAAACPPSRCGSARRAPRRVPAAANNFRPCRAAAPAPVSRRPAPG